MLNSILRPIDTLEVSDGTYCHQINLNSKAWPMESVFPISSIQEYAWKNIYPKIMPSSIFDGKIKLKIATLWVTKENRQTHIPCWEFGLFVLFVHETLVYLYSQRQPVLLAAGRGCTGMQTCKETEYTALNNIYTTTKICITKSWELWVYCTGREGLRSMTYFWASSVHWSSHLHVGISLIQA